MAEDPGKESKRVGRWQQAWWRGTSPTSGRGRVRDRKRELQEGGWGRSREVPSRHALHTSQITPQLLSPNPKVLELQGAAHCCVLWPALRGTPLTSPKVTPGVRWPHSRYLLRGRVRGPQSLKSLCESPHGRREKPAPPQPGAPPTACLPASPFLLPLLLSLPPAAGSGSLSPHVPPPPSTSLPHSRLLQSCLIQTRKNKE